MAAKLLMPSFARHKGRPGFGRDTWGPGSLHQEAWSPRSKERVRARVQSGFKYLSHIGSKWDGPELVALST